MPFVVTKGNSSRTCDRTEHPRYVRDGPKEVDRAYYLEQLRNPLATVLEFVPIDIDRMLDGALQTVTPTKTFGLLRLDDQARLRMLVHNLTSISRPACAEKGAEPQRKMPTSTQEQPPQKKRKTSTTPLRPLGLLGPRPKKGGREGGRGPR